MGDRRANLIGGALVVAFLCVVASVAFEASKKSERESVMRRAASERACADHGGWKNYKLQKIGFGSFEPRAFCADGYWTAIP